MNTAITQPPAMHLQRPAQPHGGEELLMIDGMFCGACAASLEHRLAQIPGVEEAAVDLAAGAALLRWATGRKDSDAASRVVAALGYNARQPDTAGPAAADPHRSLQVSLAIALFFGMWTMLPSIALYLDAAPTEAFANGLAWAAAIASLPVVAYAGRPFYAMAVSTLRAGAAGIDALVSIGVLGALLLSSVALARGGSDVYFEVAVALITLQLLARLIELNVARAGRDAMARLLDLAPPRVMRLAVTGRVEPVPLSQIAVNDVLLAEAGERLAVDGIADGRGARLDRHMLTGESEAVSIVSGEPVYAGEIVIEGPLRLRVTAAAGERRIDALARQVRTLLIRKPNWQRAVDRVARHFLALAVLAAAAGALLAAATGADAIGVAERALTVFVIACPCALSLAAPLAGLGATRAAADCGILLRDLRVATRAGRIDTLFVDKTGTLTEGRPTVRALWPLGSVHKDELLAVAAIIEKQSSHPLAVAIVEAALSAGINLGSSEFDGTRGADAAPRRTVVGGGLRIECDDTVLRAGSAEWFAQEGLNCPPIADRKFSRVWVARNNEVLGAIDLDDAIRAGAAEAIGTLQNNGVEVIMLSGDAEGPVARVAAELGITGIANCSPEAKVAQVEAAADRGCVTAFVGDGLNDGPAIAAADLGIAVEDALDAARTASAATLLHGGVERIPELLALVASAGRVLRQNIAGAVIYNALAIPVAFMGWVHPAIAAIAMAASSITVVLNSTRVRGIPWRKRHD